MTKTLILEVGTRYRGRAMFRLYPLYCRRK